MTKVSDLNTFLITSSNWLNSNPSNLKLEISNAIMSFVTHNRDHVIMRPKQLGNGQQGLSFYLKGQNDLGEKLYKAKRAVKIKYCDRVTVSEVDNKMGQDVTEYTFTSNESGNKYSDMLLECQKIDSDLTKETQDLMDSEIEIKPVYSKKIPTHNELPTEVVKTFIGFVIENTVNIGISRDLK